MKTLVILLILFSYSALGQIAHLDSLANAPSSGVIFGLSWLQISGILAGVEVVLRALPIPKQCTILGAISALHNILPNNAPPPKQ